jgi:hypothetical protein
MKWKTRHRSDKRSTPERTCKGCCLEGLILCHKIFRDIMPNPRQHHWPDDVILIATICDEELCGYSFTVT